MQVWGLIPARGKSKRLPRKNVRLLAGKPMIAWSIEVALNSRALNRVIVSTDDDEIAQASLDAGAEVPFIRPDHLSTDTASSIDVVFHAIETLGEPDVFVLLQPTSPLRRVEDITNCLSAINEGAPAALTVCSHQSPWSVLCHMNDKQEIERFEPEAFELPNVRLTGSVYAVRMDVLKTQRTFFPKGTRGILVPESRSLDVDYEADFLLCEKALSDQAN